MMNTTKPTESIDLVLPFILPSTGFTSAKWEDLELSDVDLVIALYPVKRIVHLG